MLQLHAQSAYTVGLVRTAILMIFAKAKTVMTDCSVMDQTPVIRQPVSVFT
jgi:hypothetical protein